MNDVNKLLECVKSHKIHAHNESETGGPTLCFNFIEVPGTSWSVITVSILKNGVKKRALEPSNFFFVMNTIERSWKDRDVIPCRGVDGDWFRVLNCQRFFFIPTNFIFSVVRSLFSISNMDEWWRHGIEEVNGRITTDTHSLKIEFGG